MTTFKLASKKTQPMDRPHEAENQGKWTKTLVKSGNYPNLRYTAGEKTKRNVSYILEQNIGLKIPKKQRTISRTASGITNAQTLSLLLKVKNKYMNIQQYFQDNIYQNILV